MGSGLNSPSAMTFGADGSLYVCSSGTNEIKRYNGNTGAFIDNFITAAGGLATPDGIAFGPSGDLFVSNFSSSSVRRYNGTTGAFLGNFVTSGQNGVAFETAGITFGPDGNLYVANWNQGRIERYDGSSGNYLGSFTGNSGSLFSSSNVTFAPTAAPEASPLLFMVSAGSVLCLLRGRKMSVNFQGDR